ncbi:MAG: hypothetical protein AAGI17_05185 [Planctomycetota bacterium]
MISVLANLTADDLTALAAVGGVAATIAIAPFGIYRFVMDKRLERQAPLWDRRIELYFEVSRVAALLGTTSPLDAEEEQDWKIAARKFWVMWSGEMILVEGADVESEMVRFGDALQAVSDATAANDADDSDHFQKLHAELWQVSLELSRALRRSISQTLNAKLGELDGGRSTSGPHSKNS